MNVQVNEPPKKRTHNRPKSKVTQAIKLFSEGKNLVDVAIALDLPPDKAQIYIDNFCD